LYKELINGVGMMDNVNVEEKKKITLSKEIQLEMLKFFMRTSIPRIKQEKLEKEKAEQAENLSDK